jgi:hypothetical protein
MTQSIQLRLQLRHSRRLAIPQIGRREDHPGIVKTVALRAHFVFGTRPCDVVRSVLDEHFDGA